MDSESQYEKGPYRRGQRASAWPAATPAWASRETRTLAEAVSLNAHNLHADEEYSCPLCSYLCGDLDQVVLRVIWPHQLPWHLKFLVETERHISGLVDCSLGPWFISAHPRKMHSQDAGALSGFWVCKARIAYWTTIRSPLCMPCFLTVITMLREYRTQWSYWPISKDRADRLSSKHGKTILFMLVGTEWNGVCDVDNGET